MSEELAIIEFENGQEAIEFSNEMWPNLNLPERVIDNSYDLRSDQEWLFVIGLCDICSNIQMFFIPAIVFEDGITACECDDCGNMSVYPEELEESDDESD